MGAQILITAAVLIIGLGVGAGFWFLLRARPVTRRETPMPEESRKGLFRWRYAALPLVVLVLSAALAAYFYGLLPEEVAYHFAPDGTPDRWASRGAALLWALLPQLLLALLALGIGWGMSKVRLAMGQAEPKDIRLERVLLAMGNMVALPQLIIGFAMVDVFSYNAYQIRIMPLWAFALIVMALGAIALGVFFVQTIRQMTGASR